jgi:hypothetical protein
MRTNVVRLWQVAASYAALGRLLSSAGRRPEALSYARVALEAKQRAFPPQHPEIAAALLALADILRDDARLVLQPDTLRTPSLRVLCCKLLQFALLHGTLFVMLKGGMCSMWMVVLLA